MKSILSILILLATTVSASVSLGWGALGHRVIGEIASRHLCADARREVDQILVGESLPEASTWADELRDDLSFNFVKPWHYATVEVNETYASSVKSSRGDVVTAIKSQLVLVQDTQTEKEKRNQALKFLIHFVGDVHQPLHVGHKEDGGGNGIEVELFGQPDNLHKVWDSTILYRAGLKYPGLANLIERKFAKENPPAQSTPEEWAEESVIAAKFAYNIGADSPAVLSLDYYTKSRDIEYRRLWQAGQRLASMLNTAMKCPTSSTLPQE